MLKTAKNLDNHALNEEPNFQFRQAQAAAFYGPLRGHGSTAARVGWESEHAHAVRLASALAATVDIAAFQTVVDAGCGEASLLPRLRSAGFKGHYRGEDALPWMAEAARRAHGKDEASEFECVDAFDPTGPSADVVFCLGALNTVIEGMAAHRTFQDALIALWNRTRVVLVVDFAIADRHPPGSRLAAVDPPVAMSVARGLSNSVVWREDTVFGEAQLTLWRDRATPLSALNAGVQKTELADLMLQAREAEGAKRMLGSERTDQAKLLRAVADAQLGRLRDAESSLRSLTSTEVGGTATLHLAAILRGTRRHREAETLLAAAAVGDRREADEARLMLTSMLAARDPEAARAWAMAIVDPFIRRESLVVVEEA